VDAWSPLGLVPAAALSAAMFAALGLSFTVLIPSLDFMSYYYILFLSPLYLFSGTFFPLTRIPEWARSLARVSPFYHAVELNRGLLRGRLDLTLLGHAGVILAVTCVFFLVAVNLMRRKLIR
jgi:lipooligosaccharide transport system permease protein